MKAHNESLQDKSEPGLEPEPSPALNPRMQYAVVAFDKIAADRLADEVAALVVNHHLDSRSAVADALLDYREPPRTPRSDRIASLEAELTALRAQITNSSHTFTRWAIRHRPSGNFMPNSFRRHTQSEPSPNCIPRLFDTRQGAVSSLNRWLEGIWHLSYYRCGEYDSQWDYDWGPEPPPTPVKSEMEVVEVEIQIRAVNRNKEK